MENLELIYNLKEGGKSKINHTLGDTGLPQMGEGGCGSHNPTCFLLTLLQYDFYEWGCLLILESDEKRLTKISREGE